MPRLRVAIVFGGRSAEHEVSLLSAKNVIDALDTSKYEPVLIGIDRSGKWFLNEGSLHLLEENSAERIHLQGSLSEIALLSTGPTSRLIHTSGEPVGEIDVLFPVLHGPYGEDGTIQGLAKLADLPCVGAGVLGSALGMDKDVMKRLLRDAGIAVSPFKVVSAAESSDLDYDTVVSELGPGLYVKPANLGSSVGISRVRTIDQFQPAIDRAFQYDTKIIVESEISGREIECGVLGNEDPIASIPGEVRAVDGFYSYKAKYIDENGAELVVPAELTDTERRAVQETAIRAFEVLCCEGMARVDGFLTADSTFLVNEINTIPGFTRISMYPKLFEASGISYTELVDRLITLAIESHERSSALSLTPLTESG